MRLLNKMINIKAIAIFCACILFIAIFYWPIEYYTFLRVAVFIGAILVILSLKKRPIYWRVIFSIIVILFNPIFPIYLFVKLYWIPIDILTGIMFLLVSFFDKPKEEIKKRETKSKREFRRDKIY